MTAIETYDLLESLFCLPGEFVGDPDLQEAPLAKLRDGSSHDGPHALRCTINVDLAGDASRSLALHVNLPILDGHTAKIHLAQPSWLERRPYEKLSQKLLDALEASAAPEDDASAYVLAAVDFLKEEGPGYIPSANALSISEAAVADRKPTDPLVRIWMHLPSLSTRSKRQDLVDYGPSYGITGVVSAGKPALLVLEGPSVNAIESYLSFIKTQSWADIPPGHKKVSEKLREEGLLECDRAFSDMQEITEIVNADGMKGVRGNRSDLGSLKAWLESKGLGGDRLAKVLGTNMAMR